jgi:hypothetical protein
MNLTGIMGKKTMGTQLGPRQSTGLEQELTQTGTILDPEQPARLKSEFAQTGTILDPEQPARLKSEFAQTGTILDPEQPARLKSETDNDPSESEGTRELGLYLSEKQSNYVKKIMRTDHNTDTWPILTLAFWKFIEKNNGNNKLANAIREGIKDDVSIDQGYPIKLVIKDKDKDKDMDRTHLDRLVRNTIMHLMEERMKARSRTTGKTLKLIDGDFRNIFVPEPDGCNSINYLFSSGVLPKNKKDKKFDTWKNKYNFNTESIMLIRIQIGKMKEHLSEIDTFIDLISQKKVTNLNAREKIEKITIQHPYQLAYMVIMLMMQIKPINIPSFVSYEIIISLQWAITNYGRQGDLYSYVLSKFTSTFITTPEKISLEYSQGITYPIIVDSLQRKGNLVQLLPCQKDMIGKLSTIVKQFIDFIINGNVPEKQKILAIATGLATGKSTIASLIPTKMMAEYNKSSNDGKRGVVIYVMPSPKTAADFAVIAEPYGSTWIGRDGILAPMHKSCPRIKTSKGGIRADKFAENGGLDTTLSLIEQMKILLDYKGDGKSEYKQSTFIPPTTMFLDPKTAAQILEFQDEWWENFQMRLFPVIDEVVASGDVKSENNRYLNSIAKIIKNIANFGVIISATLTERQLCESSIFGKNTIIEIITGGQTCRQWSQLVDSNTGKSLQPLQGLEMVNFDAFMQDSNSTLYRCMPPIIYNGLMKAYVTISGNSYPPLTSEDISSASNFLEASKRLLDTIHQYSKKDPEKCLQICRTQIRAPSIELSGRESTMTLTTGNPMKGILEMLPNKMTIAKLDDAFNRRGAEITAEIAALKLSRIEVIQDKTRNQQAGSSLEIQDKIKDLENLRGNPESWSINIMSNFGSVTVSKWWRNKHLNMPPPLLALVLSGLELKFYDKDLDEAIAAVDPKPNAVIDSISGMYGRNVPDCARVLIIGDGIGFDTIFQAAARAGREKSMNSGGIVECRLDPKVLSVDPKIRSIHRLEAILRQLCGDDKPVKERTKVHQSMRCVKEDAAGGGTSTDHHCEKESAKKESGIGDQEWKTTTASDVIDAAGGPTSTTDHHCEKESGEKESGEKEGAAGGPTSTTKHHCEKESSENDSVIWRIQRQTAENLPLAPGEWQAEAGDQEMNAPTIDTEKNKKRKTGAQRAAAKTKKKLNAGFSKGQEGNQKYEASKVSKREV